MKSFDITCNGITKLLKQHKSIQGTRTW
jgi:hypothetical protein